MSLEKELRTKGVDLVKENQRLVTEMEKRKEDHELLERKLNEERMNSSSIKKENEELFLKLKSMNEIISSTKEEVRSSNEKNRLLEKASPDVCIVGGVLKGRLCRHPLQFLHLI